MLLQATVLASHRAPFLEKVTLGLCVNIRFFRVTLPIIGLLHCFLPCHRHPRGPEKHQPLFSHTKLLWRHCVRVSLETHKTAGAMSLRIKKKKYSSRMFSTASLLQSVWVTPWGWCGPVWGGRILETLETLETLEHLLWLVPLCDFGQALSSPRQPQFTPL